MEKIIVPKVKGGKIREIITVFLGEILLEIHINIFVLGLRRSLKLEISDDSETIICCEKIGWADLESIKLPAYKSRFISDNDELSILIDSNIVDVYLGVGSLIGTNETAIYYFKILTDVSPFLFFNNGDEGVFAIQNIDNILNNDLYGYNWYK